MSIDPGDGLHGWYSLHNVRALHKRSANDCTMLHGIIHAADGPHWRVLAPAATIVHTVWQRDCSVSINPRDGSHG